MRAIYITDSDFPMTIRNNRDKNFIKTVNEIIEANLSNERFGVSELAGKMNMSRTTLHRRVKSAIGHSVSQFIRNARLSKALELLKNEPLTVAETAYMTGFRSATYFSKCFSDYFGYPPVDVTKSTFDGTDLEDHKDENASEESRNLMHNFPVQTTSFIGREKEMEIIIDLIKKNRIVTLAGTGGCGKTRLACEVVAQLGKDFPDGIWFVDLAPVETVDLVISQLMKTLELSEIPGGDMMKIIVESIRNKRLLILLDNCEHLQITCAEISRRLIESDPGISLVVTSREALKIKGEKVWIVPSLSLADPTTNIVLKRSELSEAVKLFADRAKLNNPSFEIVEENASAVSSICQGIDGLPLAIELVASRTRYMDTKTLLHRLSERFDTLPSLDQGIVDRHKTIQSTIEWSYNLISEEEKTLFRQLSVFSGDFDLTAVEEVCSKKSLPKERILDFLSKLVDRSMVQTLYKPGQQMRYVLLKTLQKYGSRLLAENGELEAARMRHLEYFTRLAEQSYEERLKSQLDWVNRLEQEHDNLVAALHWTESNDPGMFVRLSGALGWFWRFHSYYSMGLKFLEQALKKESGRTESYARLLYSTGSMLSITGDSKRAIELMNDSLKIWRKFKNIEQEAAVLRDLIFPYYSEGDDESSQTCSKKCMELARQTNNLELINHCVGYVCFNLVSAKRFDQLKPLLEEYLDTSERLNQPDGIVVARHLMGDCAMAEKEFNESERKYAESLKTGIKYGNVGQSIFDLHGIALSLAGQRRWAKCIRLDAAANSAAGERGFSLRGVAGFWDEWIDTYIERAKKEVGEELTRQYEEEGIAKGFEKAVEYAMDFHKD